MRYGFAKDGGFVVVDDELRIKLFSQFLAVWIIANQQLPTPLRECPVPHKTSTSCGFHEVRPLAFCWIEFNFVGKNHCASMVYRAACYNQHRSKYSLFKPRSLLLEDCYANRKD